MSPITRLLLVMVLAASLPAAAQGITYQGQLQNNGTPVNGDVEIYVELHNDPNPTSATLVADAGPPVTVPVSDGLFTVDLNFGDVNYTVAKYLRIRVDGTWLAETQEITYTPLAQYALGAGGVHWSGVLNAPDFWRLDGNAGTSPGTDFIGTTDSSAFEVHVDGARALRIEPGDGPNVIAGSAANQVTDGAVGASVAGGAVIDGNIVTDDFGTVAGGAANVAGSDDGDSASDRWATVGGGEDNTASGPRAAVGGGHRNEASGLNSTVGGGHNNIASASYSTVAGGNNGTVDGFYGAIGGGDHNSVLARFGTIGGGGWTDSGNRDTTSNDIYDEYGTIGGGGNNQAGSDDGDATNHRFATVGGGLRNVAGNVGATVAGGIDNHAGGGLLGRSTVGGGESNSASNSYGTVSGGIGNIAGGNRAAIGGGESNLSQGYLAFIGGGLGNDIGSGAQHATIAGGRENEITNSADGGTIPGGRGARATRYGEQAYASGSFATPGDAQASTYVLRNATSDSSSTELFLDGSSERLTIDASRSMTYEIQVVARDIDTGTSDGWRFSGMIVNHGGNVQINGGGEDWSANFSTWDVSVQADDSNEALVIEVTGDLNTFIRWVARVETVEVAGF